MNVSDNKNLVTMTNNMARASYKLTVNEIRLLLVAMAQMPKGDNNETIDPMKPYYITKDDFVRLGVEPKNVAREIRNACGDLLDRKIYINTPIGVLGTHWVHNILHFKSDVFEELKRKYPNSKYDEDFIRQLKMHNLLDSLPILAESDENIVARVVFHADVIPYISQLKQHFTQLNLSDVAGFSSFYSFRIYILMMQFVKTGLVLIKLDEFRSILELTDKYEAVKDLRKWVLDTAIDEINAKSPYAVSYELMDKNGKTGRGVKLTHLQIKFKAKEKPQKQALERDPNTIDAFTGQTDNEAKTTPTWQTKGLSDGQIKKIGVNKQEFIDANSGKISPNDRRGYDEIFEDWKPQLKDPSTVATFNKIQELLDRQRPS